MFGDDDALAAENMYKIKSSDGNSCEGIEDIFSVPEFKKHILHDESLTYTKANSSYVKSPNLSKPVLAYQFYIQVKEGNISLDDFDDETQGNIETVVREISDRIS